MPGEARPARRRTGGHLLNILPRAGERYVYLQLVSAARRAAATETVSAGQKQLTHCMATSLMRCMQQQCRLVTNDRREIRYCTSCGTKIRHVLGKQEK